MDHADIAEAAAEAGKHLLIEKPFCFSPAECDRILEAVDQNKVKLIVGYMKRYDPGYEYGVARIKMLDDVRLIRVHDIAGDFTVHQPLYTLANGDDIAQALLDAGASKVRASMKEAVGADYEQFVDHYFTLLMLCSHDLSVLRGAFGAPQGVLYSDAYSPTEFLSVLDYGSNRRCVFEAGVWPQYSWWNEHISAYGKDAIVNISFPNPYARYARTVVTIQESEGGVPVEKRVPVSHQEAFRLEWLHFYECITNDIEPRTSGRDAKNDIELAVEMIRNIRH